MIQLDPQHHEQVRAILNDYPVTFYVYGSRAAGKARRYSDLDLAYSGYLSLAQLAQLETAFAESDLPFSVDILALDTLEADFLRRITPALQKWQ